MHSIVCSCAAGAADELDADTVLAEVPSIRAVREALEKYSSAAQMNAMFARPDGALERVKEDFGLMGSGALTSLQAMVHAQQEPVLGPIEAQMDVEGQHYDVVMQCIGARHGMFQIGRAHV